MAVAQAAAIFICQIMREQAPMTMKARYYPPAFEAALAAELAAATEPVSTYIRVDGEGKLIISGAASGGGALTTEQAADLDAIATNTGALASALSDVTPAAVHMDTTRRSENGQVLTTKFASINITGSGDATLVAAVAAKRILVHNIVLVVGGTTNIRFWSGAGGTAISGLINAIAQFGFAPGEANTGHMVTGTNTALVLNSSAAVQIGGWLTYTEIT